MKFLTAIKSAKAKAVLLAAMTIATSLVGNVAPSQANQASSIVGFPGRADIITFNNSSQSFSIDCAALRSLWKLPTQILSDKGYQELYKVTKPLAGMLICSQSRNQAYTSPSFPPGYAAIEMPGKTQYETDTFYVKNYAPIFKAMRVTSTPLTAQQGQDFINANPRLKTNTVIEPDSIGSVPQPVPPVVQFGSVSFFNRGAYITRYEVTMDVPGSTFRFKTGNIGFNKKALFSTPTTAKNIKIVGEYYTGIGNIYKVFFNQNVNSASDKLCVTSTRTALNPIADNTCR